MREFLDISEQMQRPALPQEELWYRSEYFKNWGTLVPLCFKKGHPLFTFPQCIPHSLFRFSNVHSDLPGCFSHPGQFWGLYLPVCPCFGMLVLHGCSVHGAWSAVGWSSHPERTHLHKDEKVFDIEVFSFCRPCRILKQNTNHEIHHCHLCGVCLK